MCLWMKRRGVEKYMLRAKIIDGVLRMCCYGVTDMAQTKVIERLLCVYVLCGYLSQCRTGSVLRLLFKQCSALYTNSAAHSVAVGCWQGSRNQEGVGTKCRQLQET